MDPLVAIVLVGLVFGLALIAYALLRGNQTRALEARLVQLQTSLIELQAGETARRSDAQLLTTRIDSVQTGLTELRGYLRARQDTERTTMESIRRLEAVIAGTQTRGAAGENILEVVFAQLPPAWQERNFQVGSRVVEFGLRRPTDLVLPSARQGAAANLRAQVHAADSPTEQRRLRREIERAVIVKAREVRKYLDPALTMPFGVAVVPDAVYDLCSGIQAELFRMNVVLLSYSLFVPYLLLVYQTVLRSSHSIDLHRLEAYLNSVQEHLDALEAELEGRYSRALRMLTNSGHELRSHLSQVRGGLAGIQVSAPEALADAEPEEIRADRLADLLRARRAETGAGEK
jgi:DNA recombination protein RmuC